MIDLLPRCNFDLTFDDVLDGLSFGLHGRRADHIGYNLLPVNSNFTPPKILDTSSSRSDTVRIGHAY